MLQIEDMVTVSKTYVDCFRHLGESMSVMTFLVGVIVEITPTFYIIDWYYVETLDLAFESQPIHHENVVLF